MRWASVVQGRRVQVRAEVEGRKIVRTEVMMIVQCQLVTAHQAIYRMLNQIAATRLRIGVYVFDHDGCQYPDRTMCYEPIDTRLFPVFRLDLESGFHRRQGRQNASGRETTC